MYRGKRIAAVVPAHNEAALITQVITTMPVFVDLIVVVDDASSDSTSAAAQEPGDPRVLILRHETNKGVGGAIVTGHRAAYEAGADINVVMAGDAQMDPDYLPALLDPLVEGSCGFSKANRFFAVDSFSGMPVTRVVGNIVLSFITKAASGYWHIFDPQNGYTAIARDVLARLPLERISSGYSFENDLLIYLNVLGVVVRDVPVPARYGEEVSGITLRRVIPQLLHLLFVGFWRRIFRRYVLWSFSPVALFLFTGLALVLVGLGIGIWVLTVALGPHVPSAGTVALVLVPLLAGLQLLLAATVLDIMQTPG
jgi:glycosyltransferase involved in cell wall biosynthesis